MTITIPSGRTLPLKAKAGGGFESSGVPAGGIYPNKPAWATTEVLSVDGTVARGADGSAFGVSAFSEWFTSDQSRISVVADSDNPLGNNSAINFEYVDSSAGVAQSGNLGPSATGYNKIYFMFRIKMIGSGWLDSGHKFFYFGPVDGNRTLHYFDRPAGVDPERLRLINQDGVVEHDTIMMDTVFDTDSRPLALDQVLNIEVAIDRLGGTTQCWVNGVLEGGRTIEMPDNPFGKVEWYAKANTGSFSQTVNMRLYEFYIAGEAA